jgi:SAM-dependent methyltransferase
LIRWVNYVATALSIRLVRWTGKSSHYVHPKHLVAETVGAAWYMHELQRGDLVLDVGCGNGFHTLRAATRCRFAVGLDLDDRLVRVAEDMRRRRQAQNAAFLRASAQAPLPFPDGLFDCVLLLDVLEHLVDRDRVLEEVRRVLRPGGTLLLSVPNADTGWKRRFRAAGLPTFADRDHKVEYTAESLQSDLTRVGFILAKGLQPVVYDTAWAGIIDFVGGISLRLYRRLLRWKIVMAERHPGDTTGFRAVWRKTESAGLS